MLKMFYRDEDGATAVEYGLIASLIAMVMITGFGNFANALESLLGDNNEDIQQGLTAG